MSDSPMPESGEAFVAAYKANVDKLMAAHAYDPSQEHDSCGVGMVVAIDGKPRRRVVEAGIEALRVLYHRGAVDADGKTGDGAGIHLEIPQDFYRDHVTRSGHTVPEAETLCVGMVFLPKSDLGAQEICRTIVESEILAAGYTIFGWRQVPVDISVIGEKANATRPEIEQIMIANRRGLTGDALERNLYLVRRRIEKRVLDEHINDFYICSLSSRSIIYKGMFLAEQLTSFYPDLADARFVSSFVIYHQRYSTNTFPTWRLAQPFRMLAHNGEINTLLGNINWMKAHECRLEHAVFGETIEDLKPVIQPGGSDSAILDNVFELVCRSGRDAPMARCLLVPESISQNAVMPDAHRNLFAYCNAVMEPWDGPAAMCATDGRWVIGYMDRNGLRPMRFSRTTDGLLIVGSETGMVHVKSADVIEKGRVGPGQMIAVDLQEGRFYHDAEIKDQLAARHPFGDWIKNTTHLDSIITAGKTAKAGVTKEILVRRQAGYGVTLEDLELILHPLWPMPRKPSARWATIRRWRCCRTITAGCIISSARTSARLPIRRSTACARRG